MIYDERLYPYVLEPKLTGAIWGGNALVRRYGKKGDADAAIGESWECWDENRVVNGIYAGRTLGQLRLDLRAELLGTIDPNRIFPILTKIIDARDWLSVQVHPDDAYAQRVEGQPFGKTECWYVLDAAPGAELVLGWSRPTDAHEVRARVADGTLGALLRRVPVKADEVYYIPAGALHAIGAGIVLFETQQASDLTYRIFDWNRTGADGKPREMHVEKAADVLDYSAGTNAAVEPLTYALEGFRRTALVADERFFVERVVATETPAALRTHERPLIVMTLADPLGLKCRQGEVLLQPYQTAIVPAGAGAVEIASTTAQAPFLCVSPPASPEAVQVRLRDAGSSQQSIERFLRQFRPLAAR